MMIPRVSPMLLMVAGLLTAGPGGAHAQSAAPPIAPSSRPAPAHTQPGQTPVVAPPRHQREDKGRPPHGTASATAEPAPKAGTKPSAKPGTKTTAGKSPTAKPTAPKAEPPPPAVAAVPAPVETPAAPPKGTVTGQDLPRWASLRSEDVNLRIGPGMNFQIDWVYHRRDLPVQIEREYEVWRQIVDQDGVKGWVHQATLTARRSFVVKDVEQVMRRTAADDAPPVARLKPGVVGRIRTCEASSAWCEVQVNDYRGFLRRDQFWGTFPNEAVN